jgi:hypothetical protein
MAARIAERPIAGCATKELKTGKFKPDWAAKLNFYLSVVDDICSALDRMPRPLGCFSVRPTTAPWPNTPSAMSPNRSASRPIV